MSIEGRRDEEVTESIDGVREAWNLISRLRDELAQGKYAEEGEEVSWESGDKESNGSM